MQNMTSEYREWLIAELDKHTRSLDLKELRQADDSRLIALYQGLGCLIPACSHDARKAFTEEQQLIAAQLRAWGTTE